MITLQIDGAGQTGTSICVKAEGAVNCRFAEAGRNLTIATPIIYTLTQELIIDAEGKGILEITPAIDLPDDGATVNIYFNAMIDALVAHRVLGWKAIRGRTEIVAWLESCGHATPLEGHGHLSKIWIDPAKQGYRALMACEECGDMPLFSRDIAEAWPIAEQHCFCLFPKLSRATPKEVVVAWAAVHGSTSCEAPTAALAICLAALQAVGVPEGLKQNA